MAALGCLFFSLLYGVFLADFTPRLGSNFQENWQLAQDAWRQSLAISQAQLQAVIRPEQLASFKHTSHPYFALLIADLGLIASYGFLLARLMSWAFAYRIAFTTIGLNDKFANVAGRLLPMLIVTDLVENVVTLLAMHSDSLLLNLLVSLLAATKFALLALTITAALALRFFRHP